MEGNVIGTLVINYDKLSKLDTEGKKISKYKEEYEYQLEKNIITSLHNVTDDYSSNINDAETYLKNKIAALNEDSEQMMDFLKQVNELLELADAMDREVAALYQDNMERFQGISSKVGGHDGFWSIFQSIGDGIRSLAYSCLELLGLEDIYTDLKTKVRYWYECEGGRELFKTIGQGVLLGLEVVGLIGAVLAIGTVGPIIGACAIAVGVIGVANSVIGVSNAIKAYGYAKTENPAMARLVGERTTVTDELRAHNFGDGLLNDISNFAATGLEKTEVVLSVVCFSADAKLFKKGKKVLSSISNFSKHSTDNIVGTLKKIPQKGGNLKDAVKAGYNNGKRLVKELGGDTNVVKKVSSASKNTDTIVDLNKMDIHDNLGRVKDVKNSDIISNVTDGSIDGVKVNNVGVGGKKSAKNIIADRTEGLDLTEHPITNKQLSSKKMSELKTKIDNRTITKDEYDLYDWNKRFNKRRNDGVNQFWYQEKQRILNGESTTRNWTQEQIDNILTNKKPKFKGEAIQAHHTYSAAKYPQLANKGEIIYPATKNEHFKGWHGGNYKNSLPGEPINEIIEFD